MGGGEGAPCLLVAEACEGEGRVAGGHGVSVAEWGESAKGFVAVGELGLQRATACLEASAWAKLADSWPF